ncbi:hypothetical protein PCURB6_16330 [Paenibacillus curdlanolyticus]|nr:hypothetical protein PCURB6_16330 [Paenibacillus curdlanolyticus]
MLHLPLDEDAIIQLQHGWRYYAIGENTPVKTLDSVPSVLHTNEVTTFILQLHVPKSEQIYSLNLEGIHQAYELWVNGQFIITNAMNTPNKLINFYVDSQSVEVKLVIMPSAERIAFLQTPLFGQTDAMQAYNVRKLVIMLLVLIFLSILGAYSIIFYFARRYQIVRLYIGVFFLLVSGSLFLSNNGIGAMLLPLSASLLLKLKTVLGLLSVIPLYFFVAFINKHVVSTVKRYLIVGLIAFAMVIICIQPLETNQSIELIIWTYLIGMLLTHKIKAAVYFMRIRRFDLKPLLFIITLFYLLVYLLLRIYYHIWGTDLHTSLWLINFTISICLYLAWDQGELVRELEKSKREAVQSKISFFNAQIKPHFLYNAISNIMALCYTDNLKAAHLLSKFSTYLRIIFENNMQNEWIALKKELTLIDAYVEIEKARFPQKIHYQLEVEQQVKEVKIPPLSIQPFVENAIRHGLFNKDGPGTVHVTIKRQLSELAITVQDDGVGMTRQTIDNLLRGANERQGIGIINVVQRLRYIPNSHLDLQSTPDLGTVVTIRIPIQR